MSWSRCTPSDLVTIPFGTNGARITVQRRAVPAFMLLAMVMEAHRYVIRPGDTGAYNCRYIAGTTTWSNHAYGCAVDVNWQLNPAGDHLVTNMPPEMIRDIESIVTAGGVRVFRWGGRYSSYKDAMHFEVMVSPEQIASGLRGGVANMPLNDGDLDKIRTIVKNQVDESETVTRNQANDTREATIDYLDAMARELGADPAQIRSKLKPKTRQTLDRVD